MVHVKYMALVFAGLSVQPDVTNTSAEVTRWTSADHVNRYNQAHMTSVRITHHSSTGLSYDTGIILKS